MATEPTRHRSSEEEEENEDSFICPATIERSSGLAHVLVQGVIGDTYHVPGPSNEASTADSPKSTVDPAITSTVFPLHPDMAYELPALFATPPFTFPATFTRDTIAMRKKALMAAVL